MKIDMRSIYRFTPLEHQGDLPAGGDVYYECGCGHIVSSVSYAPVACECGNVSGGQGKVEIKDQGQVKPLRGKLR